MNSRENVIEMLSRTGNARSRGDLQREALEAARQVVGAIMTPGEKFPTREQLIQAWALIRAA